jgi:hypothetical protein
MDPETLGLLDSIGIEKGQPFDGSKTYKLHLPPNIPAKNFWSLVLYDYQALEPIFAMLLARKNHAL